MFFPAKSGTLAQNGASTAAPDGADVQLEQVPGATLTRLALSDIVPNRAQPRTEFDEEALEELTHSIREVGVF